MKSNIFYQVLKADFLERSRRFSFIMMCAAAMMLALFSVPNVEAPFVSICMEPDIFYQGSNATWVSITIALCGGMLFPMAALSFIKSGIDMDRSSGLLYAMQSMNMGKGSYCVGKFLSNLLLLTIIWVSIAAGAAIMIPLHFPNQTLRFYDFVTPFLGLYPGLIFVSAFAVLLESLPFINNRAGNVIGIITLFIIFLFNYSVGEYSNPLLGAFDIGNYRWTMDSINNAVIPVIGRSVQETGILVPGGVFADSKGSQELFFHGLIWNSQYFVDKICLAAVCVALIMLAIAFLESTEHSKKRLSIKNSKSAAIRIRYSGQWVSEFKLIFQGKTIGWFLIITGLWICCILAPLKYVQNYIWIIMLIFSVSLFSQLGCREHEYNLTEYFMTIKHSLVKQLCFSYLWGAAILLMISLPVIVKCAMIQNYSYVIGYISFSIFTPALAGFLGECTKSKRAFETVYLLFCFLLLNMPTFLSQNYVIMMMEAGSIILFLAAVVRRLIWNRER